MTGRKREKPPEVIPVLSGWCNPGAAPGMHDRCPGGLDTVRPCPCPCHHPPEEPPVPVPSATTPAPEPDPVDPEAAPRTIGDAVALVAAAVADLNTTATLAELNGTTWEDAARHLKVLRDAFAVGRQVEALLVRHLYLTGEHGTHEIPGVGAVKIGRGRERKEWATPELARAVVEKFLQDHDGEYPDPETVVDLVLQHAHVDYWRVTPLRAAGIDPADYCVDTPGKVAVNFL